jgi:hypothetical protein
MNWEAIGTISDLVGAIAVVATLFYLARQIRQSNTQGRRAEINATSQQFSTARLATAQNEDLAELYVRGSSNYDDLNPVEKLRFQNIMTERFWTFHSIWDGVQAGAFESYFWKDVCVPQIAQLLNQPGMKSWWGDHKNSFPSNYVREIDKSENDDT